VTADLDAGLVGSTAVGGINNGSGEPQHALRDLSEHPDIASSDGATGGFVSLGGCCGLRLGGRHDGNCPSTLMAGGVSTALSRPRLAAELETCGPEGRSVTGHIF
jgi:hypothetical protein